MADSASLALSSSFIFTSLEKVTGIGENYTQEQGLHKVQVFTPMHPNHSVYVHACSIQLNPLSTAGYCSTDAVGSLVPAGDQSTAHTTREFRQLAHEVWVLILLCQQRL